MRHKTKRYYEDCDCHKGVVQVAGLPMCTACDYWDRADLDTLRSTDGICSECSEWTSLESPCCNGFVTIPGEGSFDPCEVIDHEQAKDNRAAKGVTYFERADYLYDSHKGKAD